MTKFLNVLFFASSLISGGVYAHAESLAIRIPFAFTAGEKTMPAGDYTIDSGPPVLMIRGAMGSAMMLTPTSSESAGSKPAVIFDQRAGTPVLAGVILSTGTTFTVVSAKHDAAPARMPSAMGVALTHP